MATRFKADGKVLACGNGGSHCDAMHFDEELTGRFRENRRGLPAIAISDPSHLSYVANDFGYADRIQEIHIKMIHSIILMVEKLVA